MSHELFQDTEPFVVPAEDDATMDAALAEVYAAGTPVEQTPGFAAWAAQREQDDEDVEGDEDEPEDEAELEDAELQGATTGPDQDGPQHAAR